MGVYRSENPKRAKSPWAASHRFKSSGEWKRYLTYHHSKKAAEKRLIEVIVTLRLGERTSVPKAQPRQQPVRIPRAGYIYALEDPTTGLIKIGKAQDVQRRFKTLQIGSGTELIPRWKSIPLMQYGIWESAMHNIFADRRVRGEWFRVTLTEVLDGFKRLCICPPGEFGELL